MIFAVCFYTMCGIISSDGKINSMENAGSNVFFVIILVHHFQLAIETRNWTVPTLLIQLANFSLYWVTVVLNDGSATAYEGNQFSVLFASPLTWLTALLATFVCCIPRYLWICLEQIAWRPEFNKVKGV
jgi:hypothetical protein